MYEFREQSGSPIKLFQNPEDDITYTLGIDASTGLSEDYSVIQVLSNTIPFEQVAMFRAKMPVNEVSYYADMLGRLYNDALIVCEVNYPGNSVQDSLLQYYKYPRNYKPETHLHEDIDISNRFGFRTTELSKWILINETQMALSNSEIRINDPVTINEFINYVYKSSKRKVGAAEGFNDDTVMAFMLAMHGAKLYPMIRPQAVKKPIKEVPPEVKRVWKQFRAKLMQPRRKQGAVL